MQPPANREPFLLIVIAVLAIALVVLFSLSLWGLNLQIGHSVDYNRFGNWSDAIAGFGSLLAVIAAAIAIVGDRQAARRDEQVERQRHQTDVHHWLDYEELQDEHGRHQGWHWVLHFQNNTQAPLYQWAVEFPDHQTSITSAEKSPLKPGESFYNLPFLDNLAPSKAPSPNLRFTDRTGRCWRRSVQGNLKAELPQSPKPHEPAP